MNKYLLFVSILILICWGSGALAQGWNVTQVGYVPFWCGASHVAYHYGLTYLSTGLTGLRIVDVSNPFDPVEIGYWSDDTSNTNDANDLALDSNRIFLSEADEAYMGKLSIIDVSDPTHPRLLSSCHFPLVFNEDYTGVAVHGNYVYFYMNQSYGGDSLWIIDASNPDFPITVGAYMTSSHIFAMAFTDTLGYLLEGSGVATIVDILDLSQPAHPHSIGSVNFPGDPAYLCLWNGYLLVLSDLILRVCDITQPNVPVVVGTCWLHSTSTSMAASGNHLYVGKYDPGGVQIIDLSDPTNPILAGFNSEFWGVLGVAAHDSWVYAANITMGLNILHVSDPFNPVEVSSIGECGPLEQVVNNNNLIIGNADYRLVAMARSNPDSIVASRRFNYRIYAIAASDSYVYIARQDSFVIMKAIDPSILRIMGCANLNLGTVYDLSVSGAYAYAVNDNLSIIGVSDPTHPILISNTFWTNLNSFRLDISGNYAYIGGGTVQPENGGYLQIVDVSHPASPQQIGQLLLPQFVNDVKISGNFAFVLTYDQGLYIINISNPAVPTLAGTFSTQHPAYSLTLSGNSLFVSELWGGFEILNLTNPLNPTVTGNYNTPGSAVNIAVSGDTAFVADTYYFGIYDCSQALAVAPQKPSSIPATFSLSPAHPNPFNSTTILRYSLPTPQHVTLKVFDIQGREVGILVDGLQTAGEHKVNFDGTGLASGVYLCRMQAGSFTSSRKLVLLK